MFEPLHVLALAVTCSSRYMFLRATAWKTLRLRLWRRLRHVDLELLVAVGALIDAVELSALRLHTPTNLPLPPIGR